VREGDRGREGGREGGRKGGREEGREGGREGGREEGEGEGCKEEGSDLDSHGMASKEIDRPRITSSLVRIALEYI
jgi:hypothetical protein